MLGGKWAKHKTTITSKTLHFFIYPPRTKSWHYYTSIIIITINNLLSRCEFCNVQNLVDKCSRTIHRAKYLEI